MTGLISRDDLLWLSGILEGEGCFDLHRGKYPRVRVGMTDRDVTGRVATLFGSSLRLSLRPAPNASVWHAEISGGRAAEIMRLVLPHMGARRSAKIASILSAVMFAGEVARSSSAPGPKLSRPPGIQPMAPAPALVAV